SNGELITGAVRRDLQTDVLRDFSGVFLVCGADAPDQSCSGLRLWSRIDLDVATRVINEEARIGRDVEALRQFIFNRKLIAEDIIADAKIAQPQIESAMAAPNGETRRQTEAHDQDHDHDGGGRERVRTDPVFDAVGILSQQSAR